MWASDSFQCPCATCSAERVLRFKTHVQFFRLSVSLLNAIPLRMNNRTLNEATDNHIAIQKLSEQRTKEDHA